MALKVVGNWQEGLAAWVAAISMTVAIASCENRPDPQKWHDRIAEYERARQDSMLFKEGDIIFQTSESSQSKAIQLATHSPYSHVGILFKKNGKFIVFEAVQPVRETSLESFISRGRDGHYVIKRLKNETLTEDKLEKMKKAGKYLEGKDYDLYFGWNDDRIYCSELVYKIYDAAGLKVGELQKLKEFDLSSPLVKKKLTERYGKNIPYEEKVISPASIFNDPSLNTVIEE